MIFHDQNEERPMYNDGPEEEETIKDESIYQLKRPHTARILELQKQTVLAIRMTF